MTSGSNLKKFDRIYDSTYSDILKFTIIKCHNINDVNDIMQEVYLELWNILNKREVVDKNIRSFIMGIANNKIKKHYSLISKLNSISLFIKDEKDIEMIDTLKDDFDVEQFIIKSDEWDRIWNYIKQKKNQNIPKIFYLHYKLELTIKDISKELNLSESYIKNSIYRTLRELYATFGEECDSNV